MDDMRWLAEQLGIELDERRAAELTASAEAFRDRLALFEPSDPVDEPVGEFRAGADEHNAFRYRFEPPNASGPLGDLKVGIKDNIAVAGVPMHCGSESIDFVPPYHATAVSELVASGASIVGTTNMDGLAYFTTGETCDFGTVSNPESAAHVAGGSSAGSGAAVAAGFVDAALGTDTGGSVRIPASFCGVVGFKPTYRSISRFGMADLAPSLDHVGTLAESVETAARVIERMSGPDIHDPSTYTSVPPRDITGELGDGISDLEIGLVDEAFDLSDAGVTRTVRDATSELASLGCTVESVSIRGYADAIYALTTIESCEFASLLSNDGHVYGAGPGYSEGWRTSLAEFLSRGEYGEHLEESLLINAHLLETTAGRQYVAAQNARRDFLRAVRERFESYDALITPTTPMTAPAFGAVSGVETLLETEANTGPFNLTGHPAVSIPVGRVDGLPVGLQVVTDWNDDALAARIGSAIEQMV